MRLLRPWLFAAISLLLIVAQASAQTTTPDPGFDLLTERLSAGSIAILLATRLP